MIHFKEKHKDAYDAIMNASTLGLHLVSGTFVGLAMGYWLDVWLDPRFHTKPWLTLAFLVFGIAAGFKNVYMDVKKIQRAGEDKPNDTHSPQDDGRP
jgi:ATP synthase protein I